MPNRRHIAPSPPAESFEELRAEFETWATTELFDLELDEHVAGTYSDDLAQYAWIGWRAAHTAGRASRESELERLRERWERFEGMMRERGYHDHMSITEEAYVLRLLKRLEAKFTEQQVEIERLKRENEKLLEKFDRWANAPCADCPTLRAALEEIKRDHGKVCAMFEVCTHAGCNSSYAAWAIADAALKLEEKS